jgi:hypothetical protein
MNKICLSYGCCNKSEIYCVDKKLLKNQMYEMIEFPTSIFSHNKLVNLVERHKISILPFFLFLQNFTIWQEKQGLWIAQSKLKH